MFHKGFLNFSPFNTALSREVKNAPLLWRSSGGGGCLGALNENCESSAFCNLNKTIHVHKGFLCVSPFKLDSSQIFCRGPHGGGVMGAPYLKFHLPRRYRLRGVVEYRRNVKQTNIIIMDLRRNTTILI